MIEVIEERRLDVLHVHYAIPHSISAYLARQLLPGRRFGIVTTLHGTDITLVGSGSAYRDVTRFGIEQSDQVIAVSEWLKKETLRVFGATKEIHVVPNFVDTTRYRPREGRTSPLALRLRRVADRHARQQLPPGQAGERHGARVRRRVRAGRRRSSCSSATDPIAPRPRRSSGELRARRAGAVPRPRRRRVRPPAVRRRAAGDDRGRELRPRRARGARVRRAGRGYDSGGMKEVVEDGKSGFLVRFGDVPALARAAEDAARGREAASRVRRARPQARDRRVRRCRRSSSCTSASTTPRSSARARAGAEPVSA